MAHRTAQLIHLETLWVRGSDMYDKSFLDGPPWSFPCLVSLTAPSPFGGSDRADTPGTLRRTAFPRLSKLTTNKISTCTELLPQLVQLNILEHCSLGPTDLTLEQADNYTLLQHLGLSCISSDLPTGFSPPLVSLYVPIDNDNSLNASGVRHHYALLIALVLRIPTLRELVILDKDRLLEYVWLDDQTQSSPHLLEDLTARCAASGIKLVIITSDLDGDQDQYRYLYKNYQ